MFIEIREDIRNVLAKVSIICPALILAASRKDKIRGRIKFLKVSIITRNGFSQVGAPAGNKCAKNEEGLCRIADITIISHRGTPNEKVKIT